VRAPDKNRFASSGNNDKVPFTQQLRRSIPAQFLRDYNRTGKPPGSTDVVKFSAAAAGLFKKA
jgi:hypothetical protein